MGDITRNQLIRELIDIRKRIAEAKNQGEKDLLVNEAMRIRRRLSEMTQAEPGETRTEWDGGAETKEALMSELTSVRQRMSDVQQLSMDMKDTIEKLLQNERLFHTLISNIPAVVFALNDKGTILSAAGKGLDALGLRSDEAVGRSAFEVYQDFPGIVKDVRRALAGDAFSSTVRVFDLWFEVRYEPVATTIDYDVRVIGIVIDITRQKRLEEAHRLLSITDELTELLNRRGFHNLAAQQFKLAHRERRGMMLLFTDINDLKRINDSYGHKEGDLAIIDTANLLRRTFRESDIIARIGGDEFVVLMVEQPGASDAQEVIKRFRENIKSFNEDGGRRYRLSMGMGIARYDYDNPCSLDELLARADLDMYENKRREHNSREPSSNSSS